MVASRYREFWRVLEFAFTRTDGDLVELLAQFEPLAKLGCDRAELRALLVLRSRASHSQSKAGIAEIATVENLSAERINRLKEIAGRVIETKTHWGYPATGWRELLPPGTRHPIYHETVHSR